MKKVIALLLIATSLFTAAAVGNPIQAAGLTGADLYQAAWYCREAGDFTLGLQLMREAYDRGCDDALVETAAWYFAGLAPLAPGEDTNETAIALMDLAMEKGNAMAAYYWGLIYAGEVIPGGAFNGFVVSEDVISRDGEKAAYYYDLSLKRGYGKASRYLGHMYYYGQNGLAVDYAKAADYYRIGAESGDYTCSHLYADCLYNGIGVEKDPEKAIELYKYVFEGKKNATDYAWSTYMLGKVYGEGLYVEKDEELSGYYLELAVTLGSKEAAELLGK